MDYFSSFCICEAEGDTDEFETPWGNSYFTITREDIEALLSGKVLAACVAGEYGVFIKMEELGDDSR